MRLVLPIGAPFSIGPNAYSLASATGTFGLSGKDANLQFLSGSTGGSTITHGSQLIPQGSTGVNVGPTALLGTGSYPANLRSPTIPSRGYFRGDTLSEFAISTPYVYNNSPTNFGGVVPSGGMTIDGYSIPAGTQVVQFTNFGNVGFGFNNSTSFLFRGCRFRGTSTAPGWFNTEFTSTGRMYFFYNDMGGLGAADSQYNEVIIKIASAAGAIAYRNYMTYTTTGIQFNVNNSEITENYISKMTYYYGPNPPPGETTDKHMNGITYNGSENNALVLRNYITLPNPDDAGRAIVQTDCISFFQDFGGFPGTGTNRDGTVGYQVKDNYVGGGGFCIYAGMNAGKASNSVQNFVLTGTKVTTTWSAVGGLQGGPITAEPTWNSFGNSKSNNTYADGPNAGQSAF
jgi:hypothetical protein